MLTNMLKHLWQHSVTHNGLNWYCIKLGGFKRHLEFRPFKFSFYLISCTLE